MPGRRRRCPGHASRGSTAIATASRPPLSAGRSGSVPAPTGSSCSGRAPRPAGIPAWPAGTTPSKIPGTTSRCSSARPVGCAALPAGRRRRRGRLCQGPAGGAAQRGRSRPPIVHRTIRKARRWRDGMGPSLDIPARHAARAPAGTVSPPAHPRPQGEPIADRARLAIAYSRRGAPWSAMPSSGQGARRSSPVCAPPPTRSCGPGHHQRARGDPGRSSEGRARRDDRRPDARPDGRRVRHGPRTDGGPWRTPGDDAPRGVRVRRRAGERGAGAQPP
jgi:hypothetical protein